jgi:hypothetical protein
MTKKEWQELKWLLNDWKKATIDTDDKSEPVCQERIATYERWSKVLSNPA